MNKMLNRNFQKKINKYTPVTPPSQLRLILVEGKIRLRRRKITNFQEY